MNPLTQEKRTNQDQVKLSKTDLRMSKQPQLSELLWNGNDESIGVARFAE